MKFSLIGTAILAFGQMYAQYVPVHLGQGEAYAVSQGQIVGFANGRATLWQGSGKHIDLHPIGYSGSTALGVFQGRQVGNAYHPGLNQVHALIWHGSANNYVNLHPKEWQDSHVSGIGGNQQIGTVSIIQDPVIIQRASLWYGTAESRVDLHPEGFTLSYGNATDGVQQVGEGLPTRALLWTGSAESAIDLNPESAAWSRALGVANGQQVGVLGLVGGGVRGVIWHGDASSAQIIEGPDWNSSLRGTNGHQQVGRIGGAAVEGLNAAVFSGTAESMINLHLLLPIAWNAQESQAFGIDEAGNIVGYYRPAGQSRQAVLWQKLYETLTPLTYVLERGILVAGNLVSLYSTDGNRLVVRPGFTLSTSEAPVSLFVETAAPVSAPLYAQLIVTWSASVPNVNGTVEAYSYVIDDWVALHNGPMPLQDETLRFQLMNPSQYIGPKGEMRARVRARQSGPVLTFPWLARYDEISWRFSEN